MKVYVLLELSPSDNSREILGVFATAELAMDARPGRWERPALDRTSLGEPSQRMHIPGDWRMSELTRFGLREYRIVEHGLHQETPCACPSSVC